ncbi:pentatricopeptide repeat-containing protein At1g05600 isoform X2 [Cornus florida]|nr:pentatricopeptide repeat-containing protein At1g05600 isoform X2 [Cornus florida]XP_059633507.1 pentatricopeptide repeat-containing protein At1g05600 isoform X2 [Cornus florida]
MINILGSSGRLTEMKEVIDQMTDDSCECRDSAFESAIKAYAKAGLLDEATSLFKSIPRFNCVNWTKSLNTLLEIMLKESKLDSVHCLFLENSYGWEVKSRTRSLNLVMDALCQNTRSDLALQVFQEMNSQCCNPDTETYRILMNGLCKEGRLDEATHLLYAMFWRISQKGSADDVVIYRTLLDALCDNGHVQEAVVILDKVLRKGLKAPKQRRKQFDLNLFRDCVESVDIQQAKVLINETLMKCMVPSVDSYGAMAVDLYSEGNIDEANKVLNHMRGRGFGPSLLIYEAKMAALCREGKVVEAIEVIEREMEGNHVPTVKSYNTVIKGLCDARRSTLAVGFLERMSKQVGCVPDKETYSSLVNGLCQDGKFVEASQVLEGMLIRKYWPNVDTFNALISGLCSTGRQYEAVMWLEEMVSQGKMPQLSVWDSLVSSFCSSMAVTDVLPQILKQLTRSS